MSASINDWVPNRVECVECTRINEVGALVMLRRNYATRRFSFQIKRAVPEHFNNALGGYVNNELEIKDGLKRMAEKQFTDMGYETEYTYLSPADMSEATVLGITDAGMDETHRRRRETPMPDGIL